MSASGGKCFGDVKRSKILVGAMVVYFATAAPAALAEDLPVVPTAADVAETIQAAVDAAGVPSVTTVADAPEPQPETPPAAPEAAPVAAGTPSESQYQAPVSQYQPDAAPPVTAQAAPPAKANEVADDDAAVVPPPPSATAAATPDVVASSVAPPAAPQATPATWTWNWNWNCTDPAQAPTPDSNASSWNWNWNWNCDAPTDAATVASQYQRLIGQYQPQNVNVEIRDASPGDSVDHRGHSGGRGCHGGCSTDRGPGRGVSGSAGCAGRVAVDAAGSVRS